MSKKVISFDIGIKNMAYCLFDISGSVVTIVDWQVLSLMDKEEPKVYCNCSAVATKVATKGATKGATKIANFFVPTAPIEQRLCGRVAKYKKGEQFYCDKHSKTQTQYRLPETKKISKMNLDILVEYATSLGLLALPKKKSDVLTLVDNYLREHSLESIIEKKGTKAGDTDLIVVGKNMKRIFQDVLKNVSIDYVLIENQISTLATRMKTVQGMLSQYFIMSYENVNIEFISSANKLKMFSNEIKEKEKEKGKEKEKEKEKCDENQTQGQKYKSHKKDGVFFCEQVLSSGKWTTNLWEKCEKKKKDDLADCFLQGVWWLKRENLLL